MSSYFTVYIRRKEDKGQLVPESDRTKIPYLEDEEHDFNIRGIELLSLCTTPCRELGSNVTSIEYTYNKMLDGYGYARPLTNEILDDILNYYKEQVSTYQDIQHKELEQIERLENRLDRCKSVAVYEHIQEELADYKDAIESAKEELETYEYILHDFNRLKDIIELNTPFGKDCPYELIYTRD